MLVSEAFVLIFGLATAFVVAGLIGIAGDWLVKRWSDHDDYI